MAATAARVCISVPEEDFASIKRKIRRSRRPNGKVTHRFSGDEFNTLIWMEGDRMMASDPSHDGPREIIVLSDDMVRNMTACSTMGQIMKCLAGVGASVKAATWIADVVSHVVDMIIEATPEEKRDDMASLLEKVIAPVAVMVFRGIIPRDPKSVAEMMIGALAVAVAEQ
jgi:hypothetical protein